MARPAFAPPDDGVALTEGRHRTLAVSPRLPEALARSRPDGVWALEQFELRRELYRGRCSQLHEARDRGSGLTLAVKSYRKAALSPLNRYQVEREVRIHVTLHHPHIIALHAAFEDPGSVHLVQEYAPGGDLFEALKRQPGMAYGEDGARRVLAPVLAALAYLHDRGVLHRDVKPENILQGERGALKLADFGLAVDTAAERPVTRLGTLDYMAPEVLASPDKRLPAENKDSACLAPRGAPEAAVAALPRGARRRSSAAAPRRAAPAQVDAWAACCLAAELVGGAPPFEADARSATCQAIMYRAPHLPPQLSPAARAFMAGGLAKDPRQRSSVHQLLAHEWLAGERAGAPPACAGGEAPAAGASPAAGDGSGGASSSSARSSSGCSGSSGSSARSSSGRSVRSSSGSSGSAGTEADHAAQPALPAQPQPQLEQQPLEQQPLEQQPLEQQPLEWPLEQPHPLLEQQPTLAVAAPPGCAAAAASDEPGSRLARASSGHRLHKLFFPHDKHRRSSFVNSWSRSGWDDAIETSAHSFSAAAAAGALADGAGLTPRGGSFSAAAAPEEEETCAGAALSFEAGLAALPDAPAAVVSAVLARSASHALHLLPTSDLEDLIAPTATPHAALTGLRLAAPAEPGAAEASGASFTGRLSLGGSFSAAAGGGGRLSLGGSFSAAAAGGGGRPSLVGSVDAAVGGSLEDYIATSAAPAGMLSCATLIVHSAASPPATPSPRAVLGQGGGSTAGRTGILRARSGAGLSLLVPGGWDGEASPPGGCDEQPPSCCTPSGRRVAFADGPPAAEPLQSPGAARAGSSNAPGLDPRDTGAGLAAPGDGTTRTASPPRSAASGHEHNEGQLHLQQAAACTWASHAAPSPRGGQASVPPAAADGAVPRRRPFVTPPAGVLSGDVGLACSRRPAGTAQHALAARAAPTGLLSVRLSGCLSPVGGGQDARLSRSFTAGSTLGALRAAGGALAGPASARRSSSSGSALTPTCVKTAAAAALAGGRGAGGPRVRSASASGASRGA
ncbi:aurka-a [Scenedesmus sp. PABB004]|nr:aurka-a [Scenedesmus sp. PABB004]